MIRLLNDYDLFCVKKGATFLTSFPPFLDESLAAGQGHFNDVQNYLSGRLKAPVITKIGERDLPRRYFYDNVTHCNTAVAEKVTKDLANEILTYLNRGAPKAAAPGKIKRIVVPSKQAGRIVLIKAKTPVRPARQKALGTSKQAKKMKPLRGKRA